MFCCFAFNTEIILKAWDCCMTWGGIRKGFYTKRCSWDLMKRFFWPFYYGMKWSGMNLRRGGGGVSWRVSVSAVRIARGRERGRREEGGR